MNVIFGVCGSVAAYKAPLLVREFLKRGEAGKSNEARVIMTPSATNFIPALTLQNLTQHGVVVEMFDERAQSGGSWHIHLARACDAMIIAPCSANTLAKLAHGICDTALTAVALALPPEKPLLIAPAMDTEMWIHPATQRNCERLRMDGAYIIPPARGELASGFVGVGRLPETDVLLQWLLGALGDALPPRFAVPNGEHSDVSAGSATFSAGSSAFSAGSSTFSTRSVSADRASAPTLIEDFERYNRRFEEFAAELDPEARSVANADNRTGNNPSAQAAALETPTYSLEEAAQEGQFNAELELAQIKRARSGASADGEPFPLVGKKVLITAGPTREKIDDVRFLSNYSSGKMGFALAAAAAQMGASVELIAGPVKLPTPVGVQRTDVESAREMFDAVMERRADADILILAAAVADFTLEEKRAGKIKKEEYGETTTLRLVRTPDILAAVGAVKGDKQIIIGFALEAENGVENARKKLRLKRADCIVLNTIGAPNSGFNGDANTITLVEGDNEPRPFPPMPKAECARVILREAARLISTRLNTL
jgi:phosphopantothenoylcysteine decarboxylase/phosphopantothenate--cysteine ligase